MNKVCFILFCVLSATGVWAQEKPSSVGKPNIIFILTDDLGYGDLGVLFQNERRKQNKRSEPFMLTPNLDRLASEGATLTQYCAAPVCAPSRASLLLGVSQGHANVRNNQFDKALEDNYTLGNVLQRAGYATAAIGKWGLQGKGQPPYWPAHPLKRGFDYYYGYIAHADGHEHYPKEGLYRGAKKVWENYTEVSAVLDKCYTGDLFTAKAKQFIINHSKEKRQPFFLYLAYDTPHAVLELPTQAYPRGAGLSGGLQWLGKAGKMINTATGTPDSWVHPDYAHATYDHDSNAATPEVSWPETYKRFATVVRRIDDQVGDIVQLLHDLKIEDNTLLVFTSDNGPSAASYLPKEYVDYKPSFFQSFGPFDGIKRDVLEGGMRMPAIAFWPKQIAPHTVVENPGISYDWMSTFTDAADLPAPAITDGVSLLPSLAGEGNQLAGNVYVEYFHRGKTPDYPAFARQHRKRKRGQMQMIRLGDLVGVRYNIKSAADNFEIYDIRNDPGQENNLAGSATALIQTRMKASVLQMRMPDTSAPRPYDSVPVPALDLHEAQPGLTWRSYHGDYSWLPKVNGLTALDSGVVENIEGLMNEKLLPGNIYFLEGHISVPSAGYYSFTVQTDGKAFLRIHDIAVVDADYGYNAGDVREGKLLLGKGYHPVRIYYQSLSENKPYLNFKMENMNSAKGQPLFFVQ